MFLHLWMLEDCIVTQLVPGSQEVSRLSASPFSRRRMNGRRVRLLPGASTREPPRFLLCAACARQQAGQLVKGAHEAAFGYRLRSRSVTITF